MNLFVLSECPIEAAQQQCDKHVVKMILESAQMLSTVHRMLDGHAEKRPSKSGKRMVWHYLHPNNNMDNVLYKAVNYHHPCTVWTAESKDNYNWHYEHFIALGEEFEYRYNKQHLSITKLKDILVKPPTKIPDIGRTPFKLAMASNPECIALNDPVEAYRAFYQTKQARFKMSWSKRETPNWFKEIAA